jgi:hypothetical protein
MIRRSTWVIVLVFVVLLGVAIYVQRTNGGSEAQSSGPTATPQPKVFDVDVSEVTGLELSDNQGKRVEIALNEGGSWTVIQPAGETDPTRASTLVDEAAGLQALSIVQATSSLGEYGLNAPSYTLVLKIQDGRQLRAQVGSATLTGSGYYVQIDNSQTVYVVAKYTLDNITQNLDNPPLVPTPTPTLEVTPGTEPAVTPYP